MKNLSRFLAVCLLIICFAFGASFACSGHAVGAVKEIAKERAKAAAAERLKQELMQYIGCEFYCVDNAGYLQHGFLPEDFIPDGANAPVSEEQCTQVNDTTLNCVTRAMYKGMKLVPVSIPPQTLPDQQDL